MWDHPQAMTHGWRVQKWVHHIGIPPNRAPQALGNKPNPAYLSQGAGVAGAWSPGIKDVYLYGPGPKLELEVFASHPTYEGWT